MKTTFILLAMILASKMILSQCYTGADLLELLPEYSRKAPDKGVTVANFFQDASCTVANWSASIATRSADGYMVIDEVQEIDSVLWRVGLQDTITFEPVLRFQTYLQDGSTSSCEGNFQPECNGAHEIEVTVYQDGFGYTTDGIAWGRVNNVPEIYPNCELGVTDATNMTFWDFSSPPPMPIYYEPYSFITCTPFKFDLNIDNQVNADDLLLFFALYCGSN